MQYKKRVANSAAGGHAGLVSVRKFFAPLLLAFITSSVPAVATRLPSELAKVVLHQFPGSKVRLDGSVETKDRELWLPLIPTVAPRRKGKLDLVSVFPGTESPKLFVYSNGWSLLKVFPRGSEQTVVPLAQLPMDLRRQLLSSRFPSDLIVPEKFVLPRSFKPVSGDVSIVFSDKLASSGNVSALEHKGSQSQEATATSAAGSVFLTSLTSGTITLINDKDLAKIADFPTEGTPCGMAAGSGTLYIADQTKHRILILDPCRRQFLGQIDLADLSAPKELAISRSGRLMYVSESGANDIAVVELESRRVLMRTKLAPGPSRMKMTPDGNLLVVLCVPSGKLAILATASQRVVGYVKVGLAPTGLVISNDSHRAYVSNRLSNSVTVVDLARRLAIANIATGRGPTGLALSADGKALYVVSTRDNSLAMYDTVHGRKVKEVKLPAEIDFPGSISFLPGNRRLLVASEASDTIAVLDVETFEWERKSSIGHSSHDIIWMPLE